jgi:hypothetical protein
MPLSGGGRGGSLDRLENSFSSQPIGSDQEDLFNPSSVDGSLASRPLAEQPVSGKLIDGDVTSGSYGTSEAIDVNFSPDWLLPTVANWVFPRADVFLISDRGRIADTVGLGSVADGLHDTVNQVISGRVGPVHGIVDTLNQNGNFGASTDSINLPNLGGVVEGFLGSIGGLDLSDILDDVLGAAVTGGEGGLDLEDILDGVLGEDGLGDLVDELLGAITGSDGSTGLVGLTGGNTGSPDLGSNNVGGEVNGGINVNDMVGVRLGGTLSH